MKGLPTRSDKEIQNDAEPSATLELPDWSGCRRDRPQVGWEVMHRLSEQLLRSPWHKEQPRPRATDRPAFEL
jgi:hypothetical protein